VTSKSGSIAGSDVENTILDLCPAKRVG
jgi:hypothetical protein